MDTPLNPRRNDQGVLHLPRAGSLESITPSLADSNTRLIPPPLPPKLDAVRAVDMPEKEALVLAQMTSRNNLTAEQRQILLRRVRVLEKRLGEPLREDETGKWVVQPSTGIDHGCDVVAAGHTRSQSSLQRIKGAFGLDRVDDLEIVKKAEPLRRDSLDEALVRTLTVDSMDSSAEEDSMRAQRRRQIAKVGRLEG